MKTTAKKIREELEDWHNNPGKRNPYFVKRRICAMCNIWAVSQSYLCHGCKDILLLKIAEKLGVEVELD